MKLYLVFGLFVQTIFSFPVMASDYFFRTPIPGVKSTVTEKCVSLDPVNYVMTVAIPSSIEEKEKAIEVLDDNFNHNITLDDDVAYGLFWGGFQHGVYPEVPDYLRLDQVVGQIPFYFYDASYINQDAYSLLLCKSGHIPPSNNILSN